MKLFSEWYDDIARNNQLALLLTLLAIGSVFVVLTAHILAPFYGAVTVAYVLQVAMDRMRRAGLSKNLALAIAFGLFVAVIIGLLALIPILLRQLAQFSGQLPALIAKAQAFLDDLPSRYPDLISSDQVDDLTDQARDSFLHFGQGLGRYAGGTVIGVVTMLVYLIIVPIMVFFMLKDKDKIVGWLTGLLPEHHELVASVWMEVHHQLQNFVGGKVLQVFIIFVAGLIVFHLLGLNYAPLLAVVIGIGVIIPYIGAAIATVPVAAVAILQWGFTVHTAVAIVAYGLIQALDGNVLVPFLFAEAVALHPVAIIGAILFFGGIWGPWGVFFAIPLAVLVKAVLNAWPQRMAKSP